MLENADFRVNGPGIERMMRAIEGLIGRGAPKEFDDVGFNKQHWTSVFGVIQAADYDEKEGMWQSHAIRLLRILGTYSNTQLPSMGINYQDLTKQVYDDVARSRAAAGIEAPAIAPQMSGGNKVIIHMSQKNYGKVRVQLPQAYDRSIVMGVNKIAKEYLGDNVEYQIDDYGKRVPILWKHFSKDRDDLTSIWVHLDILTNVANWLKEKKGFEIEYEGGQPFSPEAQKAVAEKEKSAANQVKVLGVETMYRRKKIICQIPRAFPYNKEKRDIIGLTKDLKVDKHVYTGWVHMVDVERHEEAISMLKARKIDTTDLEVAIQKELQDAPKPQPTLFDKKQPQEDELAKHEISIGFRDDNPKSNEMSIQVQFRKLADAEKQVIKDTVKYLFPEWKFHADPRWEYEVKGDFTQYIHLGQILQKPPYNFSKNGDTINKLRGIVKAKVDAGGLDGSHIEGRLPEGFEENIEKRLPNSKFDLYDAQKEGVGFLYSRKHAILGDETGLGKTVQLISAAALKMQDTKKACLVVGLKGIQDQWVQSIKDVVGDNADISIDPLHPKQWTVVYYENFASEDANTDSLKNALIKGGIAKDRGGGTYYCDIPVDLLNQVAATGGKGGKASAATKKLIDTLQKANRLTPSSRSVSVPLRSVSKDLLQALAPSDTKIVEVLSRFPFEVVIFDELHKIKHDTTKRWMNIEKSTDHIPVRWGASATVSSNKAMDVRNQLNVLGHYLGKIPTGRFKRDFAGMYPGGYKGAYVDGTQEEKIIAAEKLNRWLNMTGLYVRRAKSDIREMPNLEIKDTTVEGLSHQDFTRMYREKMDEYKDKDLAISQLIAARNVIAVQKTSATAQKVAAIVRGGEGKAPAAGKTVVFTNFIESGRQLVDKIKNEITTINRNYKVLTYTSDTSKAARSQVKQVFTNDPNAKVLVMSMKMGGTGIDFPNAAQNMVINDFDWTPEAAEQSEGRIYRINTDHPVFITYMVAEGFDKELFGKLQDKRAVASVIQTHRKIYQETGDEKALSKLVDAHKRNEQLNSEIASIIGKAMSHRKNESFAEFLSTSRVYIDSLFYGIDRPSMETIYLS